MPFCPILRISQSVRLKMQISLNCHTGTIISMRSQGWNGPLQAWWLYGSRRLQTLESRRWVRLYGAWTRLSTASRSVEAPHQSLGDQSATRNANLGPIRPLSAAALSPARSGSQYAGYGGLCPRLAIFYVVILPRREHWTVRTQIHAQLCPQA